MPYGKGYNRGYNQRRGRRYRRKYTRVDRVNKLVTGRGPNLMQKMGNYGGAVGRIAKTVYGLQRMINSEAKFIDTAVSINPVSTGTITLLTAIATGDDDSNRNGNSILGKDVSSRIQLTLNASATATYIRLMLIVDKQCDGVLPAVTDVLQTASTVSPLNKDFSNRFVVIRDKLYSLDTVSSRTLTDRMYSKVSFHLHYDGATAAIADCKENQLYLLTISSEATNTPALVSYWRFNYYDN